MEVPDIVTSPHQENVLALERDGRQTLQIVVGHLSAEVGHEVTGGRPSSQYMVIVGPRDTEDLLAWI